MRSGPGDGTLEIAGPPPHVSHESPEGEHQNGGLGRRGEGGEGDDKRVFPAPGGSNPTEVSPFRGSIQHPELVHVGAQGLLRNTCSPGHGHPEILEVSRRGEYGHSIMVDSIEGQVIGRKGREQGLRGQLFGRSLDALAVRGLGRIVPWTVG